MKFENLITVVIGGGQGIGQRICLKMAGEGATVVVADIADGRDETAEMIQQAGGRAVALFVDLTSEESVRKMAEKVLQEYGRVNHLVNNSGIVGAKGHIDEISLEEWNESFSINLNGAFLTSRYFLPGLKVQGGSIVNMASVAGKRPMKCRSPYCTSKAALIGFTRCLAMDLGEFGIRANSISPGRVEGPRIEQTMHHAAQLAGLTYDEYVESTKATVPLRTFIPPDSVADSVSFLCSDEARFITGANLNVNAGSYMD
ncbi:MAG: SDR family oxidoreductase [bacterium]